MRGGAEFVGDHGHEIALLQIQGQYLLHGLLFTLERPCVHDRSSDVPPHLAEGVGLRRRPRFTGRGAPEDEVADTFRAGAQWDHHDRADADLTAHLKDRRVGSRFRDVRASGVVARQPKRSLPVPQLRRQLAGHRDQCRGCIHSRIGVGKIRIDSRS